MPYPSSMHAALLGAPSTPPASAGSGAAGPTGNPTLDAAIFSSLMNAPGNREPQPQQYQAPVQGQAPPPDPTYRRAAQAMTGNK